MKSEHRHKKQAVIGAIIAVAATAIGVAGVVIHRAKRSK